MKQTHVIAFNGHTYICMGVEYAERLYSAGFELVAWLAAGEKDVTREHFDNIVGMHMGGAFQ